MSKEIDASSSALQPDLQAPAPIRQNGPSASQSAADAQTQTSTPEAQVDRPESTSQARDVLCGHCDAVNPAGSLACSQCGWRFCSRCQTPNADDVDACSRCRSFLPANQAARTTGVYSRLAPPDDLRLKVEELRAGVTSDRGGAAELSTLELSYIEKLGDIDVTIRLLTHDIATNGLLTQGGRVRGVYDKLLAGLATFDRYAQRVGLERRAKRVPSLQEVMSGDE